MKVLIAIEDKFDAVPIVECVHNRAWPDSTQFILVNVIDMGERFGQDDLILTDKHLEEEVARRFKLLSSVREQIHLFMPKASVAIEVCCGQPQQEILLALKLERPDVVVIGKHPKNKLMRLFHPEIGEVIMKSASADGEVVHTVESKLSASRSKEKGLFLR